MEVQFRGKNYEGHGGQTIGYNAFSAVDPDKNNVITVMINDALLKMCK